MLSLGRAWYLKMVKVPSLRKLITNAAMSSKRAFFLSSGKIKGSMAVEGSLVLPLFLFFIMTVMLSLEVVRVQSNIQEALHQAGNRMAFEEYQVKYTGGGRGNGEEYVKEYLSGQLYPYLCIKSGENGVIFRDLSTGKTNGQIELQVDYKVKPFIRWLPVGDIRFRDRFFSHSWTGYCGNEIWSDREQEVYVYITKTGSKYHMSHMCTYLRAQIQMKDFEQVSYLRNQSGGKYYPCQKCKPVKGGNVYITADGKSYHSMSDCSSLKRTIYVVPLSEAGAYSACSKCGG